MKKILSLLISISIMVGCCSFYITPVSAEDTFDSYTDTQNALWHLGVKGATSSTSNYSDMHYICQPFVPSSNKINGAKIGMRLTTGTATLHLEISTSVGGTPIASSDTSINSKGGSFAWYNAKLEQELTVTPGQRYYMTIYLTTRASAALCIVHGGSISNASNSAQVWHIPSSTTPKYTNTGMSINFQITYPTIEPTFDNFNGSTPLWHLGVKGATSSAANYSDMTYICQPFVPSSNQMVGAKIGLNLSTLNATLHIEIATTPGGTPLASGDTYITSKGNGLNWYNAYLDQKLIVNPGQRYYMTVYLTSRANGALCIVYGAGTSDTKNSARIWMVSSGTQVSFGNNASYAIAFQLISSAAFTEYNATSSLYHLTAKNATSSSDSNYANMQYISQTFVPETADMYGASVSLLLTTGTATLHIDVSTTPGGTAIASGEASITSVGDRVSYYTVYFNNKATLTPYSTYYLNYYFVNKPSYAIGVACGANVGINNATYPAYVKSITGNSYSSGSNDMIMGFKILTKSKDTFMLYDGENTDGIIGSFNTNISLTNQSTEGSTGLKFSCNSPKGQSADIGGMVIISNGTKNLSAYNTIKFDLFVEKSIPASQYLQVNFATTGQDGFNITLNISNTQAGWHTYTLKTASIPEDVDADWTNINTIRFTWFNYGSLSTTTNFALDNLYATNAVDYGDVDKNGSKNASDALTTLKSSVGSVSLTNEQKTIADVSGEGKITAWDAMLILKYSVGSSTSFPVEKPEINDPTYGFQYTISQDVLCNYLARSVSINQWDGPNLSKTHTSDFILNTGAKYVSRMACVWMPSSSDYNTYSNQKAFIDDVHSKDPFVIFEACVFETTHSGVESIAIPAYVFEAFGLPVQTRNFNYKAMCFPDGTGLNQWGTNQSLPDVTQVETQMFFYYRSCEYIKLGYEALHMGQVMQTGSRDADFACWTNLIAKIRAFAKDNARRGMVLLNGHTHGIVGTDDVLIFDFHSYPARPIANGTTKRGPTESNPQKAYLEIGHGDSIYGNSLGGMTYSGWKCSSLPYFVEIDNWGNDASIIHDPTKDAAGVTIWGMDEISWFLSQPKSYREEFMRYAYKWVNDLSDDGYFCMPCERPATKYDVNGNAVDSWYYAYDSRNYSKGLDDEAVIKAIWNGK